MRARTAPGSIGIRAIEPRSRPCAQLTSRPAHAPPHTTRSPIHIDVRRATFDLAELAFEHAALGGFFVQVADRGGPLGAPPACRAGWCARCRHAKTSSARQISSPPPCSRGTGAPGKACHPAGSDNRRTTTPRRRRSGGCPGCGRHRPVRAVPVVQGHGDGLRRDDAAELGVAGELLSQCSGWGSPSPSPSGGCPTNCTDPTAARRRPACRRGGRRRTGRVR